MKKLIVPMLLALFSCVKEVNYHVDEVPKTIVINSINTAYHPFIVNVSELKSIFDNPVSFIDHATVILTEEGGETDTLEYLSDGNYNSFIYSKPGRVYHITVMAEGYPTATATDTVPEKVAINYASKQQSNTLDEDGNLHNDFKVAFTKRKGKTNYYELMFVIQSKSSPDSFNLHFEGITENIDPLILASGTTDYNNTSFLFCDKSIAEGEYCISMKMINVVTGGGIFKTPVITIKDNASAAVLRTVSKAYYDYRSSWEKHRLLKNDSLSTDDYIFVPLIGEPQDMYSNIENGLGIFATFDQDFYFY